MIDARAIAYALGGDVLGRDTVLVPGPGHSRKDRSLAIKLDASAPDGFLIYSHAGDDWKICRDHVRSQLGLPQWDPGDEQNRNIPPSRVQQWDLAAIKAAVDEGQRQWSEDELRPHCQRSPDLGRREGSARHARGNVPPETSQA
jgi:hypothetical protein